MAAVGLRGVMPSHNAVLDVPMHLNAWAINGVLRGEFGFVGAQASGQLDCQRPEPEVFTMHVSAGFCKISAASGKFWKVGVNGVTASSEEADLFTFEFVEISKVAIRAPNGNYLQGQQAGG